MEGSAAFFAHAASDRSLYEKLFRYSDIEGTGKLLTQLFKNGVKSLCLLGSAGKSVQKEALFAVVLGKAFPDDADSDFIRDKLSGINTRLGLFAKLGSLSNRCPEHIAGGNLGDPKFLNHAYGLGAFAGARRAH